MILIETYGAIMQNQSLNSFNTRGLMKSVAGVRRRRFMDEPDKQLGRG